MRELDYVVLDLDSECKETCDFCSNFYSEDDKFVHQIVSHIKDSGEYVSGLQGVWNKILEQSDTKMWKVWKASN